MADTTKTSPPGPRGRGWAFQLAALLLVGVSALAGTGLARWLRTPTPAPPEAGGKMPKDLFVGWSKPDFVLVLSGQQYGYLLPCGCSRPQVGGLERRYNFLQLLEKRGWRPVAVDLGDVPQDRGPLGLPNQQGLIKYRYSMGALKKMGYAAVSLGAFEAGLPLFGALGEWALNEPQPPVVVANLLDADKHFPEQTKPYAVKEAAGVQVGVTAVVGPTVQDKVAALTRGDKTVQFGASSAALDDVLKKMDAAKVGLRVLLYQGLLSSNGLRRPPTEAVACAEAYPQFPVVVCLSPADDAPPATPYEVTHPKTKAKSYLITLGQKGKHVGVVGVWKTGRADRPFDFKYQLVEMGEEFATPPAEEKDHPVVALMEAYTAELRGDPKRHPGGDYLARYGQRKHLLQAMAPVEGLRNPGEPTYVGSHVCKRCHESAYDVWKKTPHSHAYQTLVDAKRPALRQYDPECVVCHTVGFGYQGGFQDAEKTKHLKDVGCESCHGPGSTHARNPENVDWQKRLNPWKYLPEERRKAETDKFCQQCHDTDNDVTWAHGGFDKKWPKVAHPTPRPAE